MEEPTRRIEEPIALLLSARVDAVRSVGYFTQVALLDSDDERSLTEISRNARQRLELENKHPCSEAST